MTDDKNVPINVAKRIKRLGLSRTLWVHDGKCILDLQKLYAVIRKAKRYGCTYIVGEVDYLDSLTYDNLQDAYDLDIIDDQRNLRVYWRLKL